MIPPPIEAAPPTPENLLLARQFVGSCHPRTPLRRLRPSMPDAGNVFVKCEDETEIRSFKGRGALWRLACLDDKDKLRGVITCLLYTSRCV